MSAKTRLLIVHIGLACAMVLGATPAAAQWQADGVQVCAAVKDQTFPVAVSDGAGGGVLAWSDMRNGVRSDVYPQPLLAPRRGAPGWAPNGPAVCVATQDPGDVAITPRG